MISSDANPNEAAIPVMGFPGNEDSRQGASIAFAKNRVTVVWKMNLFER